MAISKSSSPTPVRVLQPETPANFRRVASNVYLGDAACAVDAAGFARRNIAAVVNCAPTSCEDAFAPRSGAGDAAAVRYHHVGVEDEAGHPLLPHLGAAIAFIEQARAEGRAVLIHCEAGRSRSVSVAAAYLMARDKCTLRQALSQLDALAADKRPAPWFMADLRDAAQRLMLGEPL